MVCKDICIHYRAQKPIDRLSRYLDGQKRCQVCQIYLKWDGLCCPCCSTKLRTNPRVRKHRGISRTVKRNEQLIVVKYSE